MTQSLCALLLLFLLIPQPGRAQTNVSFLSTDQTGLLISHVTPQKGRWIVEMGIHGRTADNAYIDYYGYDRYLTSFSELVSSMRFGVFNGLELNLTLAGGLGISSVGYINGNDSYSYFGPPKIGAKTAIIRNSSLGSLALTGNLAMYSFSEFRHRIHEPQGDLRLVYASPDAGSLPLEINVGGIFGFRPNEPPLLQYGIRSGTQASDGWSFWLEYFGYTNFDKASHWSSLIISYQADNQLQLNATLAFELHPGLYALHEYRVNKYTQGQIGICWNLR